MPAQVPLSLHWDGDDLIDLAAGHRHTPDGRVTPLGLAHPFTPDSAAISPTGRFGAVWTERGARVLVLDLAAGTTLRELPRAGHHARDYDLPFAFGRLPDGREVYAHCPRADNRIDIEEAATGRLLTERDGEAADVFHSRLAFSPDGRRLLSAGWVWHPHGVAEVFDVAAALTDPATLDEASWRGPDEEVTSAAWLDADRLAVATMDFDGDEPDPRLGIWSFAERRWTSRAHTVDLGVVLPAGDRVVALYRRPRLLDPVTGRLLAEWPEVAVPRKDAAFGVQHVPTPVAAVHPDGTRLAVAGENGLTVLALPAATSTAP